MPILVPLPPLNSEIERLHQARPKSDKPEVTLQSKNDEGKIVILLN